MAKVTLNNLRVTKTRAKEIFCKDYLNKEMSLKDFVELSNFNSFKETSKTIDKVKAQYSEEVPLLLVQIIAYLKNLNNSHKYFYKGVKFHLNKSDELKEEDKEFKEVYKMGVNSILVEYNQEKDLSLKESAKDE